MASQAFRIADVDQPLDQSQRIIEPFTRLIAALKERQNGGSND
jgi:hypothetical protein